MGKKQKPKPRAHPYDDPSHPLYNCRADIIWRVRDSLSGADLNEDEEFINRLADKIVLDYINLWGFR